MADWKDRLYELAVQELDYPPERPAEQKKNASRRQQRAITFKLRQEGRALQREARYRRIVCPPRP
jgi:hypothetical protein